MENSLLDHRRRIHALLSLRRREDAIRLWHETIAPHASPTDWVTLAELQIGARRFIAAREAAERAVAAAPELALTHYTLGRVFACDQRFRSIRPADRDGRRRPIRRLALAEASLTEAIRIDPGRAKWFGTLAGVRIDRRDLTGAEEAVAHGLAIDPLHLNCRRMQAIVFTRQKTPEKAVAAARAAAGLHPESADSHRLVAEALIAAKDYDAAVESFAEAIRLDPTSVLLSNQIRETARLRYRLYRPFGAVHSYLSSDVAQPRLGPRAVMAAYLLCTFFSWGIAGSLAFDDDLHRPIYVAFGLLPSMALFAPLLCDLFVARTERGRMFISRKRQFGAEIGWSITAGCAVMLAAAISSGQYVAIVAADYVCGGLMIAGYLWERLHPK